MSFQLLIRIIIELFSLFCFLMINKKGFSEKFCGIIKNAVLQYHKILIDKRLGNF